ncbi:MAG: competence/damage-inducible protein A [Rickettsiales bacterium]|nr:competence/damage-inducible protein A [Rickettsiales bacterium]
MTDSTASVVLIGNEILSGRTPDQNLSYIGLKLADAGVRLREARIIPDDEQVIIDTVNELRARDSYVFTTGGIGPTHDDITSATIAKAFDVPLIRHPEAEKILLKHYRPEDVNDARMKMADIPDTALLIPNPVSAAPGFRIGNVFVMAGVPRIMQAMMDYIAPTLEGGPPVRSASMEVFKPEGDIADAVTATQAIYQQVEIGCYPLLRNGKLASTLVLRCNDASILEECSHHMQQAMQALGAEVKLLNS